MAKMERFLCSWNVQAAKNSMVPSYSGKSGGRDGHRGVALRGHAISSAQSQVSTELMFPGHGHTSSGSEQLRTESSSLPGACFWVLISARVCFLLFSQSKRCS